MLLFIKDLNIQVLIFFHFQAFEKILDITDDTVEPNLIQISVQKGMSRNEVVEKILNNIV